MYAKLAYSVTEGIVGLLLLGAGTTHRDLASSLHRAALRELREDSSDFFARHVLHLKTVADLHPGREALIGAGVLAYAAVKIVLVIGILREARRQVQVGAVVFVLIAAGALVVLVRDPSPIRGLLGVLDIAVAVVVIRESRRVGWRSG